jgi:hypothetical protein
LKIAKKRFFVKKMRLRKLPDFAKKKKKNFPNLIWGLSESISQKNIFLHQIQKVTPKKCGSPDFFGGSLMDRARGGKFFAFSNPSGASKQWGQCRNLLSQSLPQMVEFPNLTHYTGGLK